MRILKKDFFFVLFLFLIGIATRIPLIEKMQSHWDGPQFSIGVMRYSLIQETPAPPGYPLYIGFGKIIYPFAGDSHISLLIISILFSGLGASIFYLAGKTFFNKRVGVVSSLLFLSGATFYFLGLTAHGYIVIPFTSTIAALIAYQVFVKKKKYSVLLGGIFSIAIGFRPQEAIFLLPLYLASTFVLSKKQALLSLLSFSIVTFGWLTPVVFITGGVKDYLEVLFRTSPNGIITLQFFENYSKIFIIIFKGIFLSFGIGCLFLLFYIKKVAGALKENTLLKVLRKKEVIFFSLWILPALMFNVFIRSDQAGHQMTYLSGFLLLIAYAIWESTKKSKNLQVGIVVIIVLFNLFTFFRDRDPYLQKPYIPTSFHYSEIRKNDIKMGAKVSFIKKNYSSNNTAIVTSSLYWRPVMYYFPKFIVYSPSGLDTTEKKFQYIFREGRKWNMKEYNNYSNTIIFSSKIKNIIFYDDEAQDWIQDNKKKIYLLKGNSSITVVSMQKETKVTYGFKFIKI